VERFNWDDPFGAAPQTDRRLSVSIRLIGRPSVSIFTEKCAIFCDVYRIEPKVTPK